jgi:hypothetical protein
MRLVRLAFLLLSLFLMRIGTSAQDYKHMVGHRFTNEEIKGFLLEKSTVYKTLAVKAAIAGPVLMGVGIYMIRRHNAAQGRTSGAGTINSYSQNRTGEIGALIGVSGTLLTIYSVPLFILSSTTKKQASLILSDQSACFHQANTPLPALGIQITF